MKAKFLFSVLLIFTLFYILSCASTPSTPPVLTPEHESLIGTRWVSPYNSGDSISFIDRSTMIMTHDGRQTQGRYSVNGNRIIVGNNILSYERRGDDLYLIGYLSYTKE